MSLLKKFKITKRDIKFFWQRLRRGWDDSDTWNLDCIVAKLVLSRLKRFKEVTNGYPADMTSEEWNQKINLMISSFEFYASDRRFDCSPSEFDNAQLGLDLFAKHYSNLWW